jgi:competence protein ComEA
MWKKFIKDYFSFSSSDRNGLIVLSFLIFLIILFRYLLPLFDPGRKSIDLTAYHEEILLFYSRPEADVEALTHFRNELFYFDPNKLTLVQMEKLGLSKRLSGTIQNYLVKGGRFREVNDLKKIYGMNDSIFGILAPYIRIEKEVQARPKVIEEKAPVHEGFRLIELNSADTSELKILPGIGSVLSLRIIKYRELLGGFYDPVQVKEVFGISETLFVNIQPFIITDSSKLRFLKINEAPFNEILRHPYISYDQTVRITAIVQKQGEIRNLELLVEEKVFDSLAFKRIRPYLSVDLK